MFSLLVSAAPEVSSQPLVGHGQSSDQRITRVPPALVTRREVYEATPEKPASTLSFKLTGYH